MFKLKFVRGLAFFVEFVSLLVAIGWTFDISSLRDIPYGMIPMKFTTALCFMASGIVLYSVAHKRSESSLVAQMILPSAVLLILLVMSPLLVYSVLGFHTNLDIFFDRKEVGASTIIYGRAAITSMIGLISIAIAGMLFFAGFRRHLLWFGTAISFVGSAAVIGYIINQPFLYFSITISGISTAMALLSAMLFILVGIGFILCGNAGSEQN